MSSQNLPVSTQCHWSLFEKTQSCSKIPISLIAAKAGLVSFFDFIVGANGEMLLGSGEGLEEGDEYDDIDCKFVWSRTIEL